MKNLLKVATLSLALGFNASLFAGTANAQANPTPLVSSEWLKTNLDDENLVVLDIRSQLAGASQAVFEQAHIPGAVYSDYLKAGWRIKNGEGVPGVLPSVDQLEALIGDLGIDEDSHVVIVGAGKKALDMGSATRVYWTLKVMGHDNVSILDGGFSSWLANKEYPVEKGASQPEPTIFTAEFRPELLATKTDVKTAIQSGVTLVDNRPANQFVGVNKHGAAKRFGTISGARNLPESWFTENGGGKFRSPTELKQLYAAAGVSAKGAEIDFCNTGHWGSLGWFVSHELLGNDQAKLYDASLVEWSADKQAPMSRGISITN